uniref:Uncharacterized protein n=1 Tax=Shewanella decolorationis TaxID=256839 RepID=A0A5B8QWJ2_9GAMM
MRYRYKQGLLTFEIRFYSLIPVYIRKASSHMHWPYANNKCVCLYKYANELAFTKRFIEFVLRYHPIKITTQHRLGTEIANNALNVDII